MNISKNTKMDAAEKEARILSAFRFENETSPFIIYDVNYWLFGEVEENIPLEYCGMDPSVLFDYQLKKIESRPRNFDDVYIPFLMPWYGTGVLASGFGVNVKFQDYMDPAVDLPPINDIAQLKDLNIPDFEKEGLMPRVLNSIQHMRSNSNLPVGVTDCQGPLTTAIQIIGYENIIYWMYDHPEMIHDLMQKVTDALIGWVTIQKQFAGQSINNDAYVLGVKIPEGYGGVWISDDDCVIFDSDLYREFAVPYNSQVLEAFGGGAIHLCGNANQHINNFLETKGLHAIHNLILDDIDGATKLRNGLAEKKITYMVGDFNMKLDYIEEYISHLFKSMGTKGLIFMTYIAPALAIEKGKYFDCKQNPADVIEKILPSIMKYNRASIS